jgi:hypothetical protein
MKKIRLDLSKLTVESFTASSSVPGRGTVEAHATFGGDSCDPQVNSCGPQTCGDFYCAIDTLNPDCSGTTGGTVHADSCDECLTIWTDSPRQCPCG